MLPALIKTMASTGISWSAETLRRMAEKTSSNSSGVRFAATFDFDHRAQPLAAANIDGDDGAGPGSQERVCPFDGLLDVLRVVIPTVDDDQIFQNGR